MSCPVTGANTISSQGNVVTCPKGHGSVSTSPQVTGKKVFVIGVGMTKFIKPGNPANPDYHLMSK